MNNLRRIYVHDAEQRAAAMKAGKPLRLEFRGGSTTFQRPNGQQVRAHPKPGKAARKAEKRDRVVARNKIIAMQAEALAAQCMEKGGGR